MKKINTIFICSLFLFLTCCGDSNEPEVTCAANFSIEFSTELNAISAAVMNFGLDPSPSNCTALKNAYNSYITALEGWEECANINNTFTSYQQALDQAKLSINALVC